LHPVLFLFGQTHASAHRFVDTYEHTHRRRKVVPRDRTRRKIIPAIDLADFKIPDQETDAIYLTVAEIRALYEVDLSSHPEWGRFRDMFVLGCYTGLRFSDYSGIKPEDIRKGMLYKKQSKSDHWVVIPLRAEAHDILINRFNKQVPKTTNEELNRHIKKVGQLTGINTQ
jgi:integrase